MELKTASDFLHGEIMDVVRACTLEILCMQIRLLYLEIAHIRISNDNLGIIGY